MDELNQRLEMSALADAIERDSAGVKCACGKAIHWPARDECWACAQERDIVFVDAQLVGDDGDVEVGLVVAGEEQTVRVRWTDLGDLEVVEASSPAAERFCETAHEVQDFVEMLHSRWVRDNVPSGIARGWELEA